MTLQTDKLPGARADDDRCASRGELEVSTYASSWSLPSLARYAGEASYPGFACHTNRCLPMMGAWLTPEGNADWNIPVAHGPTGLSYQRGEMYGTVSPSRMLTGAFRLPEHLHCLECLSLHGLSAC